MTEREIVLRERAAYARGRIEAPVQWGDLALTKRIAVQLAAETYPMPKKETTRPRVVRAGAGTWRCWNGTLQMQNADDVWEFIGDMMAPRLLAITSERVRIWADLLANPNETVDA